MELISLVTAAVIGIIIFGIALNSYFRSLKIDSFTDKYILITGCDTGIGYVAAKKLDAMGFHVFAACLTTDKVKELGCECSDRLVPFQMDVTKEESVQKAFNLVKEVLPKGTGLWALLNNAGILGSTGLTEWLPKTKFEEPINVNLIGTVCVTTTFLPLVRLSQGRIAIISSVLGRLAVFPPPYSVSKYCVEGYSDWLRFQLLQQGISVHTLEPGGRCSNITNFQQTNASLEKEFSALSSDVKEFYGEEVKHKLASILKIVDKFYSWFKVDSVADVYVHVVSARHPKIRYVIGWDANIVYRLLWTVPTWLSDFVIGTVYPRPKGCV